MKPRNLLWEAATVIQCVCTQTSRDKMWLALPGSMELYQSISTLVLVTLKAPGLGTAALDPGIPAQVHSMLASC